MKLYIIIAILFISLSVNIFFVGTHVEKIQSERINELNEDIPKVYFNEKLFSDSFSLKDYSGAKFTLEEKGKNIIKNAREFHSSPALIKGEAYNENLCAGYIFELSSIMWDPSAPYMIGMMDQETKQPADAWQLPYSYEYVGGKILSDFTGDFSLKEKNYWEEIDTSKLKDFFNISFSETALFGDIGFFYRNTEFLKELQVYENSNSHVTKNIGVSTFSRNISNPGNSSHREVLAKTLGCDSNIFISIKDFLKHYEVFLDGERVVFNGNNLHYLEADNSIGKKVVFNDMSELRFKDVTLMHFFKGAQVQSLFEMTCGGDFYPINILSINPRFIEKM